jgi:hypothetical protein
MEETQPTILRTASDGCFEIYDGAWGKYLRPTFDPTANAEVNKEHLEHFELKSDIHRIPADLWQRWVQLCFYYVDKISSSLEVSVRILRSEEDPSKYRFIVPRQEVTAASVRANDFSDAVDIETGEAITEYPPVGWIPVGSSHSHNTMQAFFSGTDDKYELGDPGIHIVIGSINLKTRNYSIKASVVGSGRRFDVKHEALIDATPMDDMLYHPNVLTYVTYTPATRTIYGNYNPSTNSKTIKSNYEYRKWWGGQKLITEDGEPFDDFSDPHYASDDYHTVQTYWDTQFGKSKTNTLVKIWNVEDTIIDFLKENSDNIEEIKNLQNVLSSYLGDIDEALSEDCIPF